MAWVKNFDTGSEHLAFSVARLKTDFDAQPPEIQSQTRDRVRQLLVDEAARDQKQPSYLRRIARDVYGVTT